MNPMLMGGKPDDNSDDESGAKLSVLQELRKMAMDAMGDKLGSKLGGGDEAPKQVSVLADNPDDLKKGLDMAKHVADKGPLMADGDSGDSSLGSDNDDDLSLDEIEQLMQELAQKKREKMMQG
jgi:hypothetical protein